MSVTKRKEKKDKIEIRAPASSGVVCGVPFTGTPLISMESQLTAQSPTLLIF